jgi:hypothetical protein
MAPIVNVMSDQEGTMTADGVATTALARAG